MRSVFTFLGDEQGAVTIEFTVLLPFFLFVFMFFADVSVVYLTHSEMYNAARDAARRMATGQLETPAEVLNYAGGRLQLAARQYVVDPRFSRSVMTVTIAVRLEEAAFFGMFLKPILGETLVATAAMRSEPRLVPLS